MSPFNDFFKTIQILGSSLFVKAEEDEVEDEGVEEDEGVVEDEPISEDDEVI